MSKHIFQPVRHKNNFGFWSKSPVMEARKRPPSMVHTVENCFGDAACKTSKWITLGNEVQSLCVISSTPIEVKILILRSFADVAHSAGLAWMTRHPGRPKTKGLKFDRHRRKNSSIFDCFRLKGHVCSVFSRSDRVRFRLFGVQVS